MRTKKDFAVIFNFSSERSEVWKYFYFDRKQTKRIKIFCT